MEYVGSTRSICPECLKVIDATILEGGGGVFLEKTCQDHGTFRDVYWSDQDYFNRAKRYNDPRADDNRPAADDNCPYNCGLCDGHESPTLLVNIDVTNRCNMCCPICFANAGKSGYVLEPSRQEIRGILKRMSEQSPIRCTSVQFSGGEPTVRDDLPELVTDARNMGFSHIQVATNGRRFAEDLEYAKRLRGTGLKTIYFQFDGVTKEPYLVARGYNALPEKLRAMENMRAANLNSVVLVPTVVRGLNDSQLGDIVRFAFANKDIVSAVNLQPVSFSGRIEESNLMDKRITIPDIARMLEEQTEGQITMEDIYPVPIVNTISRFVEAWKGKPQMQVSCHEHCGAGTYLFKGDEGDIVPINRFVDVEGVFGLLKDITEDVRGKGKVSRAKAIVRMTRELPGLIDNSLAPRDLHLKDLMMNILTKGTAGSVVPFHKKALFLGVMHFMDPYNFDVERARRCSIHYGLPDGSVIPFCSYNNLHRRDYERAHGIPLDEWKMQNRGK